VELKCSTGAHSISSTSANKGNDVNEYKVKLLEKILEQGAIEGFFQAQNIAKAVKLIGYLLRGFSPSGNDKKAAVSNQLDLNMEATSLYDILCNGLLSNKENLKPCNSKS